MGYAVTTPFALYNVSNNTALSYLITLSTVAGTKNLGDITTPEYAYPLKTAYAQLVVQSMQNTNASDNYFDSANIGHLNLNDGSDHNCGAIPARAWYTPASSWVHGDFTTKLAVNIASVLKPNTTYTASIHEALAKFDNLLLYNPRIELNLTFGV